MLWVRLMADRGLNFKIRRYFSPTKNFGGSSETVWCPLNAPRPTKQGGGRADVRTAAQMYGCTDEGKLFSCKQQLRKKHVSTPSLDACVLRRDE